VLLPNYLRSELTGHFGTGADVLSVLVPKCPGSEVSIKHILTVSFHNVLCAMAPTDHVSQHVHNTAPGSAHWLSHTLNTLSIMIFILIYPCSPTILGLTKSRPHDRTRPHSPTTVRVYGRVRSDHTNYDR